MSDEPIEKGTRREVEFAFASGFEEFFLPGTGNGRELFGLPKVAAATGTDEGKAAFWAIPSCTGSVEFDVAILPGEAVAARSFETFGRGPYEALLFEKIAAGIEHVLAPEKHLLLKSLGKISLETGRNC